MTACPLEDRIALEDLTIAYAAAVDAMGDPDDVARLFTPDCEFDLSGIG
ncbi:MAG: nuclear transport factor 2 family protein, partial [Sphingomonadales bacterium]|nr:nuclear transport factor 2 family protein [Sphingomonadales bacterium]